MKRNGSNLKMCLHQKGDIALIGSLNNTNNKYYKLELKF